MLQLAKTEESLRDRVMTIPPSQRVERLRRRYLETENKAVIHISRIITRVMRETGGEPLITRRAKAFAATVREVPVNIHPDELFVGWLFSEPHATEVPVRSFMLAHELDTLSTREYTPFYISEEDAEALREEIFPYWKSHYHSPSVPRELKEAGITSVGGSTWLPHFVADYEKVLDIGLLGIKQQAEEKLNSLDLTEASDVRKRPFLEGVILALEAAAEIGKRFADEARHLAESTTDADRKAELLMIAEVCDRVPARPARTFYEAMQSVWFVHMLLGWESQFHGGQSPGKADQYFYPYYRRDVEEGRLTREKAQEMLDCWFMRYSQMFSIVPVDQARFMSNHTSGHDLTVGGLKADGSDATNELSYMFIEAMMHVPGMVEPTLVLLVHSKTPEDLLIKACQLTALGGGYPQFVNQDLMVENLLARGALLDGPPITLETAREYSTTDGCHHPTLAGMESGYAGISGIGLRQPMLPSAFEYVLHNGIQLTDGRRAGLETGDPRQFGSFEEFRKAFGKQVAYLVKCHAIADNIGQVAALQPTVFSSALTNDCIKKGIPREEGGARYSIGGGGSLLGSVDIGNSLAAIKKLVYDEERISMDRLLQALECNFEQEDEIRKMCLEAPKFGTDDDDADGQVAWATQLVTEESKKYKTIYGGLRLTGLTPLSSFVPAGLGVAALPSGRLAGSPLADALSPTVGSDVKGPTAVLKSVGKVNNAEQSLGSTLNMKLDPAVFEQEDGFKKLADLIRVFVDQKIDQVQFNVVAAETLKAAQEKPDEYTDLVVKVAGYNARFIDLHKELQDSIIARTEHEL